MSYMIQRVEWKDVRDDVSVVLRQGFPAVPLERYAWLHEHNPAGAGALWLARAPDGRPVGTAAVHPRRMLVDGETYRAGVTADFAVDRTVRGFGPALLLQRAVVQACASGEFTFLYGCPNRSARAVFERIGYRGGEARRLVRPLRSRGYLERSGVPPWLARLVAIPIDAAMSAAGCQASRSGAAGGELLPVEAFDGGFDAFWERVRRRHAVIADRDSHYMNWRYLRWPSRRYAAAVLRRGPDVAASIVWSRIQGVVYVADALAVDGASWDALLVQFLRMQRSAGAAAVSLTLLGDSDLAARLDRYRFVGRGVERTMVAYVPPSSPLHACLARQPGWSLFEGDIL